MSTKIAYCQDFGDFAPNKDTRIKVINFSDKFDIASPITVHSALFQLAASYPVVSPVTLTNSLIPAIDGFYDIGEPANKWQDLYANNLNASNVIVVNASPEVVDCIYIENSRNGAVTFRDNIALNPYYLSGDGDDEGIFVDNSGNVGIGTATPSTALNIVESVGDTESTTGLKLERIAPEHSRTTHIYMNSVGNTLWDNDAGALVVSTPSTIFLRANSQIKMNDLAESSILLFSASASGENEYLFQYGYVDAVSAPKYIRHQLAADGYYKTTRQDVNVLGWNIGVPLIIQPDTDSTTAVQVLDSDGGVPVLNIDTENERVGIGVDAPMEELHVYNTVGSTFIEVENTAADSDAGVIFTNDATTWLIHVRGALDDLLRFRESGVADHMVIKKTTGNVGIGTTSPDELLDVRGNIQASGTTVQVSILDVGDSILLDPDGDSYFDGGSVGVGTKVPAASMDIVGNAIIGQTTSSADYSEFEPDGTLKFIGNATVFRDINFAIATLTKGAAAPSLIDFAGSNIEVLGFNGAATPEEVSGAVELDHSYKEGSNISPHIHWTPVNGNGGDVKWQLEYTWENPDATFGAGQTITATTAAGTVAWDERRTDFPIIDGTGMLIESQFAFRLFRDPTDDADTYGSNAAGLTFGFHVEMDTIGSREKLVK